MYPQDHDTQAGDEGEKANCATGPDGQLFSGETRRWVEWVEKDQRKPGEGQAGCQAELGSCRIWTVEDMIKDNDEQADQYHNCLKVCIDATAKLNLKGWFDK